MDKYNRQGGPAYDCVNPLCKRRGAWLWVAAAKDRGVTSCKHCGTPFRADAIRTWPPFPEGGKARGRGRGDVPPGAGGGGQHLLQGGKGSGGAVHHHLPGGGGGGKGGGGVRPVGLQAQPHYHLQGGQSAKGAPKGGAKGPARAKSELAKQEERLAHLQSMYADAATRPEAFQAMVEQQKRIVDQARQEEENRRSPAEKLATLRKELGAATDALAKTVFKDQTLCDQIRALEEQQELNLEEAYTHQERAEELRQRIREEELKCNLKPKKVPGEQVDPSAEAKVQRALAMALSTVQSCFEEQALGVEEAQLAPIRENMGLVWGQVCAILSSGKPVPAEDAESAMQDVEEQQKPSKSQKKEKSEEELAARAAAMLRGDWAGEEDEGEEQTAEAWNLVVSKRHRKDFEKFCRKVQCLGHEDVAQKVQMLYNKAQGAEQAKPKGKGKGGSTVSPTEKPSSSPGTPVASYWDVHHEVARGGLPAARGEGLLECGGDASSTRSHRIFYSAANGRGLGSHLSGVREPLAARFRAGDSITYRSAIVSGPASWGPCRAARGGPGEREGGGSAA